MKKYFYTRTELSGGGYSPWWPKNAKTISDAKRQLSKEMNESGVNYGEVGITYLFAATRENISKNIEIVAVRSNGKWV